MAKMHSECYQAGNSKIVTIQCELIWLDCAAFVASDNISGNKLAKLSNLKWQRQIFQ